MAVVLLLTGPLRRVAFDPAETRVRRLRRRWPGGRPNPGSAPPWEGGSKSPRTGSEPDPQGSGTTVCRSARRISAVAVAGQFPGIGPRQPGPARL